MNPTDQRRAAALMVACFDGNENGMNRVLDEAAAAPGGIQGVMAALAAWLMQCLIVTTGGEAQARRVLEGTLLDASVAE
ncbi:hypothetical protein [Nocardia cyriacigeorgica]|uniref:hypothetical protein n=1 Tax=Nocardia cyriacigeorgica TaxID=135487 RepID=UPI00030CD9BB|nr:hypothetical protein [Nocardia cyriacigeorgica]TLF52021.1 hypothetical protein FEK31_28280 [Nocardia cyriacigeorgica]